MQTKTTADTNIQDMELNAELAGILTAISVVSKRLAKKLMVLQQDESTGDGGEADGQNERT
jgi:hypothetical protein